MSSSPILRIPNLPAGSTTGQTLRWDATKWVANSDLIVTDAGNVGIGTSTPLRNLTVAGNGSSVIDLLDTSDSTRSDIVNDAGVMKIRYDRGSIGLDPHLEILQDSTERMRIDSTGNVGIGTTTPVAKLQSGDAADADDSNQLRLTANNFAVDHIVRPSSVAGIEWKGSSSSSAFIWSAASTERMRISSTGNVGIGVTGITVGALSVDKAPPLDRTLLNLGSSINLAGYQRGVLNISGRVNGVDGNASISLVARTLADNNWINGLIEYGQDNYMAFHTSGNANVAPFERMRLDASGNLLVGKTAQNAVTAGAEILETGRGQFTTDGTTTLVARRNGADGNIALFYNDATVVAQCSSDGTWTGPLSDISVKENIADSTLGLAQVMDIQVRQFDWKANGEHIEAGFIAQELQAAIPQAVAPTDDGLLHRADANLIPVLVKAIQEQQAMLTELNAKVDALT